MIIFNYIINKNKQLDVYQNRIPFINIHKNYINKKGEKCCRRIFTIYFDKCFVNWFVIVKGTKIND